MLTGVPFFSLVQAALCLMTFWIVWTYLKEGRGKRAVILGCIGLALGVIPVALIGGGIVPLGEDAMRLVLLGGATVLMWSISGPAAIAGLTRIAVDRGTARVPAIIIGLLLTLGFAALLILLMQVRG